MHTTGLTEAGQGEPVLPGMTAEMEEKLAQLLEEIDPSELLVSGCATLGHARALCEGPHLMHSPCLLWVCAAGVEAAPASHP